MAGHMLTRQPFSGAWHARLLGAVVRLVGAVVCLNGACCLTGACCHLVAQVRWCLLGDVALEQVGSKGCERRRCVPEGEEALGGDACGLLVRRQRLQEG